MTRLFAMNALQGWNAKKDSTLNMTNLQAYKSVQNVVVTCLEQFKEKMLVTILVNVFVIHSTLEQNVKPVRKRTRQIAQLVNVKMGFTSQPPKDALNVTVKMTM